jgi:hypothetical protein
MNSSIPKLELAHWQSLASSLLIMIGAFAIAMPAAPARAQHVHPAPRSFAPVVGAAAPPIDL